MKMSCPSLYCVKYCMLLTFYTYYYMYNAIFFSYNEPSICNRSDFDNYVLNINLILLMYVIVIICLMMKLFHM